MKKIILDLLNRFDLRDVSVNRWQVLIQSFSVHPYTINDVATMQNALNVGVDGMFTNFADRLIGLLGAREAKGLQGALDAKLSHAATPTFSDPATW